MVLVQSLLLYVTYEVPHREVYQDFEPRLASLAVAPRAKGCLNDRTPDYTAQLLTLYQDRANNQCIG